MEWLLPFKAVAGQGAGESIGLIAAMPARLGSAIVWMREAPACSA